MNKIWSEVFIGFGPAGVSGLEPGRGLNDSQKDANSRGDSDSNDMGSSGGQEGGDSKKKKPRFHAS